MTETKIDTSKIKPGDVVTVLATVKRLTPAGWPEIECEGQWSKWDASVAPDHIVSHEPRELKAGDIVTVSGKSKPFQIIAIDCLRAFLKPHGNTVYSHCVHHLSELERAP